jgi:hypothetical protein
VLDEEESPVDETADLSADFLESDAESLELDGESLDESLELELLGA